MSQNKEKYDKYFKSVEALNEIDVYMTLRLFDVKSQAVGHAIKKLLIPGCRTGGKSYADDIREARDTLNRELELLELENDPAR